MLIACGSSRRSNSSWSLRASTIPPSGGLPWSMHKADSNIATFPWHSWHCLRLSCSASCGRCPATGGPHGLTGCCKHNRVASLSILQDNMIKSVEKVRGYNTLQHVTYPSLRDLYIASRLSTLWSDQYDRKVPVQSATGRCRMAHRGPCRSSGATVCHPPDPPEVARSPAAPSTRSESYTVVREDGRCSGVSPSQSYVCTSTTTPVAL